MRPLTLFGLEKPRFKLSFHPDIFYQTEFSKKSKMESCDLALIVHEYGYTNSFIEITELEEDGNDVFFAPKKFQDRLIDIKEQLKPGKTILRIGIPSPLGTRLEDGKTSKHAITALIDTEAKKIILYDPYVGTIHDSGETIRFHPECRKLIEEQFSDYEFNEHDVTMQYRGEVHCYFTSTVVGIYFLESKGFPTRPDIEREWTNLSKHHNEQRILKARKNVSKKFNFGINLAIRNFFDNDSRTHLRECFNSTKVFVKKREDVQERFFDNPEHLNLFLNCILDKLLETGKIELSDGKYKLLEKFTFSKEELEVIFESIAPASMGSSLDIRHC